ncbi:MAG: alcohol dehydrogenase catalytic domain-containing protein [bacterium]
MLAAVYRKEMRGLRIEELPEPALGPGQVRVRVCYASICGSDLFLVGSGQLPEGTILGHEMSGQVDGLGEAVQGLSLGDNVIVRPIGCGVCPACSRQEENLCPKRLAIGLGVLPGAFAERLVVPQGMVIPVPEGLDLAMAALAEPLATALHGIRLAGIGPGERVAVLGAGGIGLCAVAVLGAMGVEKILVSEPQEGRRRRALALGASRVVDPIKEDLYRAVSSWCDGQELGAALECAGSLDALRQAMEMVSPGGKVVLIGLPKGKMEWAPAMAMLKQLRFQGSYANTQRECRECLEMLSAGRLQVREVIQGMITLEELPVKIESLLQRPGDGKVLVELRARPG